MPPADDLPFANYQGADGNFVLRQGQFGFADGFVHKKFIGRDSGLIAKTYISHYISLLPFGTGLSMDVNTISPFSSAKPVTRNSDIKLAICLGGKLITPTICFPGNCSFV